MNEPVLATPVAMTVFNRPRTTARVFQKVAAARPKQLLIVADGPRPGNRQDAELCAQVLDIVTQVDWDCEVIQNASRINMGCRRRMSSGLDWVFENVDRAIILEDDCVPDPTFFRFCQELLNRFEDDKRVMSVTGTNLIGNNLEGPWSYLFSRYANVWGWATWRRSWQYYDVDMSQWPSFRDFGGLRDLFDDGRMVRNWRRSTEAVYQGRVDTWDAQWGFACWIQSGLTVVPGVNLISNVGFDRDATHTRDATHRLAGLPASAMDFPLRHPDWVLANRSFDNRVERDVFFVPFLSLPLRIVAKLHRWWTKRNRAQGHVD